MWPTATLIGFTILSWNTLSDDDVWADGWGCPLEQDRRDYLMLLKDLSMEEAQDFLTLERYQRIRRAILEEVNMSHSNTTKPIVDMLLFQELTRDEPWDELEQDKEDDEDDQFSTTILSLYESIPCPNPADEYYNSYNTTTLRRVYIRKNSGYKWSRSFGLETDVLQGGCLVELQYLSDGEELGKDDEEGGEEEEGVGFDGSQESVDSATNRHNKLYIVNLHGKSGDMRNPEILRVGMSALWNEISNLLQPTLGDDAIDDPDMYGHNWKERIILCGDWNVHLANLPQAFAESGEDPHMVAAMLDNQTATNFSTNHEAGFLAQYDGCILANSSTLQLVIVSRNIHGFMVKGEHGQMPEDFSYDQNRGVLYEGTLLPATLASDGMSDHVRIYTTVSVDVGSYDNKNKSESDSG
jgi:hypothetical protein